MDTPSIIARWRGQSGKKMGQVCRRRGRPECLARCRQRNPTRLDGCLGATGLRQAWSCLCEKALAILLRCALNSRSLKPIS